MLRSVHSTFTRTFPLFIIPALLLLFLLNGDKGLLRLVTVLFAVLVILALHYAVQSIPFANNAEKAEAQDHLSGRGSLLEDQCFFRISLLLVGLITLAAGIMQANFLHWSHGSDGYSYLQIARDYANGEFAVRGYWSPLISWLTAILMKVGLSPEMAIRYVIVLSGLATVSLVVLLAKRFNLRRGAILALAALTALLVVSQTKVTADLIGVATLLLYILVILHPRVEEKPVQMGALGGFIAAIAYFARSYNLTFIIAHLIIYALYVRLQKGSVKPALRFISVLLLTMVIVVSPWIYSLSNRYHHLTFSTSALHTRGLVAPGARDWSTCMNGSVLCDHPTDIMFPWEDHLPELQPNYNWSPFSSAGNLKHQLKLTASNIIYVIRLNIGWSIMGVICLVCLALFWNDKKYRNMALFLLLTAGLYSGGYMMTLANGGIRYFVVPYILVFLLLVYTVQYVRSRVPEQKKGSFLALSVAALLAISFSSTAREAVGDIRQIAAGSEQPQACEPRDAKLIAPYLTAPFAMIEPGTGDRNMLPISYYTQVRTLGYLNSDRYTPEELDTKLRAEGIRTVLVRPELEAAKVLPAQYGYKEIAQVSFCDTKYVVFKVQER